METGTRRGSCMLVCALLLTAAACTDSEKPTPTGAQTVRLNESDDDDDNGGAGLCPTGGVIAATVIITQNTRLTCDVVCTNTTGPCIQFGKNGITFSLNGFKMTGPANPPANCAPNPGAANPFDGISTAGFDHVRIRGPGMVQRFRRHGIFMPQSEKSSVKHVTSHHNCFSGILLNSSHRNELTDNVSVRNGIASGGVPCGGSCIVDSHNNSFRRNHFYGNGSAVPGIPLGSPNDFGIGLLFSSSGNVLAENNIGGNINGILIFPAAVDNLIRHNVIAGNPPVQVFAEAGPATGVDIRDASPANANRFEKNHCITYQGATTPAPCPNFSRPRSRD